jgi:transcriptional regulator with XRE-family HTH domain
MLVRDLLSNLRDHLRLRIRNGEITERGLARKIGISQSHIHNVLKGARILTPEVADQILRHLKLSILELVADERGEFGLRKGPGRESSQPSGRTASRYVSKT